MKCYQAPLYRNKQNKAVSKNFHALCCKNLLLNLLLATSPLANDNPIELQDANEAEKKTSTVPVVASATTDKGIKSRRCMDEFKDAILTNIINRGVFNDRYQFILDLKLTIQQL